jgi:hypothetical protein
MIKQQLHSNIATTKGFVLDLDFSKSTGKSWADRLVDNKILDGITFTHVVEI